MKTRYSTPAPLQTLFYLIWVAAFAPSNMLLGGERKLDFNRDVRPILSENCLACHGFDASKREAGLGLDTRGGAIAELASGEVAIKPGNAKESELVRRILSTDEGSIMPPPETGKHLTEKQKQILQGWIDQGAEYAPHWSFIAPRKPTLPNRVSYESEAVSKNSNSPIDLFIRERLHEAGLPPSDRADAITLIRRASLDVVGLPPTPEEVDAFVADFDARGSLAYEALVDKLLKSPHYGERWGRWWLDQARYADSNGYSIDAPREIWLYRDWVIDAFNRDMPFDQFATEQLAGDLLPEPTNQQRVATGFHRNTQINQEGGIDQEQFRIESVFDRVATTGSVFLGLTVGCAQCHDHKFDPISQKEYYQLFAFFNNQDEPELTIYPLEVRDEELKKEKQQLEQGIKDILAQHADGMKNWEEKLTDEQKKELNGEVRKTLGVEAKKRSLVQQEGLYAAFADQPDAKIAQSRERIKEIDKQLSRGVKTMVFKEREKPRKTNVFIQGDFTRPADEVTSGTLSVLHPFQASSEKVNRLDLAQWIVSPSNPLTARVIVNRVWQHYFGRGIVETENDFGLQGALPTHPELLDWLAIEFIENGWSLKELHQSILTSDAYQQRSHDRPDLQAKDRDNYLLARQRRLRLDAEIVRDVGLVASGLFAPKMGGPPVFPPIPDGVMSLGQSRREWKVSPGEDRYRRGLYTFVFRATPPPSLNVFDSPDGYSTCTRRVRSNTPLQALTLLNDTGFFEFAQALSEIVKKEGVVAAFRRCTGRKPQPTELDLLKGLEPLSVARVLLNLDETVTRE